MPSEEAEAGNGSGEPSLPFNQRASRTKGGNPAKIPRNRGIRTARNRIGPVVGRATLLGGRKMALSFAIGLPCEWGEGDSRLKAFLFSPRARLTLTALLAAGLGACAATEEKTGAAGALVT